MNRLTALLSALILTILLTSCGNSDSEKHTLENIPQYPDSTRGETMEHSSFGGFIGGKLEQFSTSDSYDDVLAFYENALSEYEYDVLSHTSELGRQTAFSIPEKNKLFTVAIQEFTEEGQVNISFMSVKK